MSKRNRDVDMMEFMVSYVATILILRWNVGSEIEARMGTRSDPELARSCRMGVKRDHSDGSSSTAKAAPNSTTVMTIQDDPRG